jgi:hypothetical protein
MDDWTFLRNWKCECAVSSDMITRIQNMADICHCSMFEIEARLQRLGALC